MAPRDRRLSKDVPPSVLYPRLAVQELEELEKAEGAVTEMPVT